MSDQEVEVLKSAMLGYGKQIDVLEWGSGGSTVYFTEFLKRQNISYAWLSLEYNKLWSEKISGATKNDPHTKVVLFDVGNTELKQRSTNMDEYVNYPASLGKKFDLIIVDGRKRRRCLLESAKLLKPGGKVFLHDAKRTYYHCAFKAYPDSRILLWSGLWQGRLENPGLFQTALNLIGYWCFRIYTFSFRFRHMRSLKQSFINLRTRILNLFIKIEEIDEAKKKWNRLAQEDARYYILTDKEVSATEESFSKSGHTDVENYFLNDPIINEVIKSGRASLLEIGCGIGRLSEHLASHVDRFYGVDISDDMIAKARERLKDLSNAEFHATDGMSFPIADKQINVVFSFIVFQHMPSVEVIRKNIEEISRVLKPGGVAKIQLRGIPVGKDKWYYGPSFNQRDVAELISGTELSLLKLEGEGSKYFWGWFNKKSKL